MIKDGIKAEALALVVLLTQCAKVLEEGLVEKVIDVQDFDHPSAISLANNADHYEEIDRKHMHKPIILKVQ